MSPDFGIELAQGANEFLQNLLGKAEEVTWIPSGVRDALEGYLLADGTFVNQLLVSLGLARVTKDKKIPFAKEMRESELLAKERKLGIWK